jgi:hypothetical protein
MPNFVILAVVILLGLAVLNSSAKGNEEKYWEKQRSLPNPPEHGLVDNQASGGAWLLAILIAIVGVILAYQH